MQTPGAGRSTTQPAGKPRRIVLLGSTGSIGTQAIDVVDGAPHLFEVVALSAGGGNLELLAQQAVHTKALAVGIASGDPGRLRELIDDAARAAGLSAYRPEIVAGPDASTTIAAVDADVVLNGITGSIGLAPTLAALGTGATLALANKESLIVGGALVKAAAREGQIVPVDSEHSAIAQCLRSGSAAEVDRLILTASGGPFRGRTRERLADVTP
ncbi:MAG: 1-deoxy-D-xylulose-5-phosphate reductoisomerase, partial [Arthrobacter sp.]|nr:1-deoxy-D-xylulose-5-phosphate reductoisomerase [Arthrobacter sp.]